MNYKTFKYTDEDGEQREWEQLVEVVVESVVGTSGLNGGVDSCLAYYTSCMIESLDQLPGELQLEIDSRLSVCGCCEWNVDADEGCCCDCDGCDNWDNIYEVCLL